MTEDLQLNTLVQNSHKWKPGSWDLKEETCIHLWQNNYNAYLNGDCRTRSFKFSVSELTTFDDNVGNWIQTYNPSLVM